MYGAMSQQPLTVPPGLLIFNDIRIRGFWLTGGFAKVRTGCPSASGRWLTLVVSCGALCHLPFWQRGWHAVGL